MKQKRQQSHLRAFISNLMKGKSEDEINDAEHSFRAYIQLARDIQKRKQSKKSKPIDE